MADTLYLIATGHHEDGPDEAVAWVVRGTYEQALADLLEFHSDEVSVTDPDELAAHGLWWSIDETEIRDMTDPTPPPDLGCPDHPGGDYKVAPHPDGSGGTITVCSVCNERVEL